MMSESAAAPAAANVSARPMSELRSGYDLPVYGLDDGNFLRLHVVALSLIFCSLACAVAVVVWSFRTHNTKFFTWSQGGSSADGGDHSFAHGYINNSGKLAVYPRLAYWLAIFRMNSVGANSV